MSAALERKQFMIGKYEVIALPIPHLRHMLLYTVYLDKTRIGAMVSVPTESDCRFLEKPPPVPPLKVFYVTSRPGRPKKGTKPAASTAERERNPSGLREVLPPDVLLDGLPRSEDR
ncbi:MAG: hypothetical protein ACREUB_04045 [Burkholderiales bacterium]